MRQLSIHSSDYYGSGKSECKGNRKKKVKKKITAFSNKKEKISIYLGIKYLEISTKTMYLPLYY